MTEDVGRPDKGLVLRSEFSFDRICVIQSLPPNGGNTGKRLYEELLDLQYSHTKLKIDYVDPPTVSELLRVLRCIRDEVERDNLIPILHFETHADREGMKLASGEYIQYKDLMPTLRRINELTRNNMLCVLSACEGAYISFYSMAEIHKRAPFWGVVGPTTMACAGVLEKGYKEFYQAILEREDLNRCVEILNRSSGENKVVFTALSSVYLFLYAFRSYLKCCEPEKLNERVKSILSELPEEISNDNPGLLARYLKYKLGNDFQKRHTFERARTIFFMHDIFPDNKDAFSPTYEDMLKIPLITETDA